MFAIDIHLCHQMSWVDDSGERRAICLFFEGKQRMQRLLSERPIIDY